KRRALRTLAGEAGAKAELQSFCLDDNYGWDDGLICGGRMNILADPLTNPRTTEYFRAFRKLVDEGRGCTEAVVVGENKVPLGSSNLSGEEDKVLDQLGPWPLPETVHA